jgi:hypothetical protein
MTEKLAYVYLPREGDQDELGYAPPQTNAYGTVLQHARFGPAAGPGVEQVIIANVPFDVTEGSPQHEAVRTDQRFRQLGAKPVSYASASDLDELDELEEAQVFSDTMSGLDDRNKALQRRMQLERKR